MYQTDPWPYVDPFSISLGLKIILKSSPKLDPVKKTKSDCGLTVYLGGISLNRINQNFVSLCME